MICISQLLRCHLLQIIRWFLKLRTVMLINYLGNLLHAWIRIWRFVFVSRMTLFKKQNRSRITVVNLAVRDIVVSDLSSGKKSKETDCDETGTKLEAF